jgi:alpha-glucoside transport system substrate-binding protein
MQGSGVVPALTVMPGCRVVRGSLAAALILAAATAAGGCAGAEDRRGCAALAGYGQFDRATVEVYGSIRDREADLLAQAWAAFARCTGIAIAYEGGADFEARLPVRVAAGDAPDLAFLPQPGLIEGFVAAGRLARLPAAMRDRAVREWSPDWLAYGTVGGTLYATPLGANVKSLVWYSPEVFARRGYRVPASYAELLDLTARMARDGVTPWCVGVESGDATGWPATDWVEEILLRQAGPQAYDRWVRHQIPFDDPAVVRAVEAAGAILRDERYVNGGHGGVRSIAGTPFQRAGLPVLTGRCGMHRQGSFYAAHWPPGTRTGPRGDVYAFRLPGRGPSSRPVLGGGEFAVAFTDRPEVRAVRAYLASADFADARLRLGNWLTAHRGADAGLVRDPVDRLALGLLRDPAAVFRFDGSDLMPAAVGGGSFRTGMVAWLNGRDTRATLAAVEDTWPR